MTDALAHTSPDGRTHPLREHLLAVAHGAETFGARWGAGHWAGLAGLWHDLGKYRPGFQDYIRSDPDAHIEGKLPSGSEKTHSAAGALHALKSFESGFGAAGAKAARILAYVIAGHHAGLADWNAPAHRLFDRIAARKKVDVPRGFGDYEVTIAESDLPTGVELQRRVG